MSIIEIVLFVILAIIVFFIIRMVLSGSNAQKAAQPENLERLLQEEWQREAAAQREREADRAKQILKDQEDIAEGKRLPPKEPEKPKGRGKIKGNISRRGKIYHTPKSPYYKRTKAEKYFHTEAEAVKAGFRRSC